MKVNVDVESDHFFGSHLDNSLEVFIEADSSLTQPGPLGLHACHITVTSSISSDEEEEVPDHSEDDFGPPLAIRRLPKAPIQARLRQSRQGRQRAKEGPSTKCHGRVHLLEYSMSATKYVRSAAKGKTSVPAYSLLIAHKVPAKSISDSMEATTVLLDTGASMSLIPAWQAEALKVR